jgi:hypothetical protein
VLINLLSKNIFEPRQNTKKKGQSILLNIPPRCMLYVCHKMICAVHRIDTRINRKKERKTWKNIEKHGDVDDRPRDLDQGRRGKGIVNSKGK